MVVKTPACRTHDKSCVKMHACRTHGKLCVNMHASGNVYKWEVILVRRGRDEHKGKRKMRERKERKKEGKRRKGERKREKMKLVFRRSEFVGLRSKVCIFDEGYAPRGRDSFYFGLFPP